MKKTKLFILFLILLTNLGCFWLLPVADREGLDEYVSEEDVAGVWSLSPESLDELVRDGFRIDETHQYQIEFFSNGECVFQSAVVGQGRAYRELNGEWKLEHDTTGNSNVMKKNTIAIDFNRSYWPKGLYLNFDRQGEDLVLWQYYGDPDSQDFMEYTKVE